MDCTIKIIDICIAASAITQTLELKNAELIEILARFEPPSLSIQFQGKSLTIADTAS